jgi:uncharacterized membrane protein
MLACSSSEPLCQVLPAEASPLRYPILSQAKMKAAGLVLWMLVFCAGCAGPTLTSRVVQEEPSWFVRLDSYGIASTAPRYDHPSIWTSEEITAILGRLLLEDRVGLMDSAQPPRAVFSLEEIALLAPAIKESFQSAAPHEWIAYCTTIPHGSDLAVTSGGIFVSESLLHIVVANHRTLLARESADFRAVRENPFHSVRGSDGALTFESSRYVVRRQANWSGGHRASASELVLDHRGFFSILERTRAIATPPKPLKTGVGPPSISAGVSGSETEPQTVILQLREEIERLKRIVAEQEAEIARLQRHR